MPTIFVKLFRFSNVLDQTSETIRCKQLPMSTARSLSRSHGSYCDYWLDSCTGVSFYPQPACPPSHCRQLPVGHPRGYKASSKWLVAQFTTHRAHVSVAIKWAVVYCPGLARRLSFKRDVTGLAPVLQQRVARRAPESHALSAANSQNEHITWGPCLQHSVNGPRSHSYHDLCNHARHASL